MFRIRGDRYLKRGDMEKLKIMVLLSVLAGLVLVNIVYGADRWSSLIVETVLWITALNYAYCYVRGLHHVRDVKKSFIRQDMTIHGERIEFSAEPGTGGTRALVRLTLKPLDSGGIAGVTVVFRYALEEIEIVSRTALALLSGEQDVCLPLKDPGDVRTLLYALQQGTGRFMVEVSYSCRAGQRMKKICELHPRVMDPRGLRDLLEEPTQPAAVRIEKAVHLLCKAWILTAMQPVHGGCEEAGDLTP